MECPQCQRRAENFLSVAFWDEDVIGCPHCQSMKRKGIVQGQSTHSALVAESNWHKTCYDTDRIYKPPPNHHKAQENKNWTSPLSSVSIDCCFATLSTLYHIFSFLFIPTAPSSLELRAYMTLDCLYSICSRTWLRSIPFSSTHAEYRHKELLRFKLLNLKKMLTLWPKYSIWFRFMPQ